MDRERAGGVPTPDAAPDGVTLRIADEDDGLAVRRLLDVALLELEAVEERIDAGDVLVATGGSRLLGTVVLDPDERGAHVAGIAVRRRRRGSGIGSALVEAARAEYGRLTAAFDADVRPFYESLGFEIEPADERDRYRGELRGE